MILLQLSLRLHILIQSCHRRSTQTSWHPTVNLEFTRRCRSRASTQRIPMRTATGLTRTFLRPPRPGRHGVRHGLRTPCGHLISFQSSTSLVSRIATRPTRAGPMLESCHFAPSSRLPVRLLIRRNCSYRLPCVVSQKSPPRPILGTMSLNSRTFPLARRCGSR